MEDVFKSDREYISKSTMKREEIHLIQEAFRELIRSTKECMETPMLDEEESVYLLGILQGYQHGYELVRNLK